MEKSIDDTVMEARPVLNCTTSVNMTSGMPSIKDRLVAFEKRAALTANANCLRENLKIPLAAVPSLRDRLQSFERSEAATMANGRRRAFAMPSCDDAQSVGDRLRAFKRFSDSPRAVGQQSATAIMSPAAAPELERRVKALKASLGVGRLDKVWPPKCVARVCTDKSRNRSNAVEKVSGAVTCSSRAENAGERAMVSVGKIGVGKRNKKTLFNFCVRRTIDNTQRARICTVHYTPKCPAC